MLQVAFLLHHLVVGLVGLGLHSELLLPHRVHLLLALGLRRIQGRQHRVLQVDMHDLGGSVAVGVHRELKLGIGSDEPELCQINRVQ